jgi:hypothetical protein
MVSGSGEGEAEDEEFDSLACLAADSTPWSAAAWRRFGPTRIATAFILECFSTTRRRAAADQSGTALQRVDGAMKNFLSQPA